MVEGERIPILKMGELLLVTIQVDMHDRLAIRLQDDLTERIDTLYAELRSSLTVRSALEFDLKKANRILEEVNRVKAEVEKVVEMLRVMDEYMKERIK